MNYLNKRKT